MSSDDPHIRINHNARIGNFIYDLIIIRKTASYQEEHCVFEIKFYRKEIHYSYLHQGVSSFLLAIANYEKYIQPYIGQVQKKYYMIWVYIDDPQKRRLELYKEKLEKFSAEKGMPVKIVITHTSEINSLMSKVN